jgi:hypothetical protein
MPHMLGRDVACAHRGGMQRWTRRKKCRCKKKGSTPARVVTSSSSLRVCVGGASSAFGGVITLFRRRHGSFRLFIMILFVVFNFPVQHAQRWVVAITGCHRLRRGLPQAAETKRHGCRPWPHAPQRVGRAVVLLVIFVVVFAVSNGILRRKNAAAVGCFAQ